MDHPQTAIPILPMPPRLPHPVEHSYANGKNGAITEIQDVDELLMTEADTQAVGKFVREFVTTALLPWMERNIIDWNENVRLAPLCWTFQLTTAVQRNTSCLLSALLNNKTTFRWSSTPNTPFCP